MKESIFRTVFLRLDLYFCTCWVFTPSLNQFENNISNIPRAQTENETVTSLTAKRCKIHTRQYGRLHFKLFHNNGRSWRFDPAEGLWNRGKGSRQPSCSSATTILLFKNRQTSLIGCEVVAEGKTLHFSVFISVVGPIAITLKVSSFDRPCLCVRDNHITIPGHFTKSLQQC